MKYLISWQSIVLVVVAFIAIVSIPIFGNAALQQDASLSNTISIKSLNSKWLDGNEQKLNELTIPKHVAPGEVLDLNGNLRDADEIIYDLGMTWDNLSRAQQTALAQTVAGTRQYTQLVSLMENFDAFQGNVDAAKNSEGTLSEQQDIYAEGWEAASKRVKAAAQDIYDSILNDEFFIDLLNGFEKVLDGLGGLIDGFGGLKGIAASINKQTN